MARISPRHSAIGAGIRSHWSLTPHSPLKPYHDRGIVNVIQTWLYLIGTPERARKLRLRVDGLISPPLDELFGPEPNQCPTSVILGAESSRKLYANPNTRPALDAWDTGSVSKADIRRWCMEIEKDRYNGPVYNPSYRAMGSYLKVQ